MSLARISSAVTRTTFGSVYASVVSGAFSVMQVRTATKRAAGSKTHMKDSAGRRLGPKKQDGVFVKPGQIIMRQRGTKFYPGENVGIGRDHTIFATEPGWVRYYLDPFHPKRKFIGVALQREVRLPRPHFDPSMRRFGGVLLEDPNQAGKEETRMSRKEHKAFPEILENQQQRETKRLQKLESFKTQIPNFIPEPIDLELASNRLLKIDGFLRGGKDIKTAQSYATYNYKFDLKLSHKRGELTEAELGALFTQYKEMSQLLDSKISFDSHFGLRSFISEEESAAKAAEIIETLKTKYYTQKPVISKQAHQEIHDLIYGSKVFNLSTEVSLKRRFLKPIDTGKTQLVRRYNYEKRRVETMERPIFA